MARLHAILVGRNIFAGSILALEAFHTASRVDQFLLSRKERMTLGTDLQTDVSFGRLSFERFSTGARDVYFCILRMNIRFHE